MENNIKADILLNQIVKDTMIRFNKMSENEYLKALGVDTEKYPNLNEGTVNDVAMFNMLLVMQRKLLKISTDLDKLCAYLDMKQKTNAIKEQKREGKRNGK